MFTGIKNPQPSREMTIQTILENPDHQQRDAQLPSLANDPRQWMTWAKQGHLQLSCEGSLTRLSQVKEYWPGIHITIEEEVYDLFRILENPLAFFIENPDLTVSGLNFPSD